MNNDNQKNTQNKFLETLSEGLNGSKFFTNKQLNEIFNVRTNFDKQAIAAELKKLIRSGQAVYDSKKRSYFLTRTYCLKGKIQITRGGYGFFINDDNVSQDLFVAVNNLKGALNNDSVEVIKSIDKFNRQEAKVINITKRNLTQFIGRYNRKTNTVTESASGLEFIVTDCQPKPANGSNLLVEIMFYPSANKLGSVKVLEVISASDNMSEVMSIAAQHNNFIVFDAKTLQQASQVPTSVSISDMSDRLDLRDTITFTIDGADARDFDDAVSIDILPNGNFKLGVHIADVSHYVRPHSPVDKEALKRATSVYFPGLVLPMLPVELSNNICSLLPNEDRLTMSVIAEINGNGNVVNYNVYNSVIKSNARLLYDDVTSFLNGTKQINGQIGDSLKTMEKLANILIDKRKREGGINFESSEALITLDNNGNAVDVKLYEHTISHQMIEEFMILANEVVATHINKNKAISIFRVHESPSLEKLSDFATLINSLGINAKVGGGSTLELQAILQSVQDTQYYNIISKIMLRTMSKARYSPTNIGHYGLNSKCYCHFTSPIRRYPDLVVHRTLKQLIKGVSTDEINKNAAFILNAAEQSSIRERQADEAEREVDNFYKADYASKLIGQQYIGIISGVMEFGIFVELANTLEGLVRTEILPQDYYRYDEITHSLRGKKVCYSMGDKVKVQIISASKESRKIEMQLV